MSVVRVTPFPLAKVASLTFFAASILLLAGRAEATECTRECGSPCTGGCEVDSIDCSTACTGGGCPGDAFCQEYGSLACSFSQTYECEEGGVGGSGDPLEKNWLTTGETGWAVVQSTGDGSLAAPMILRAIAASSDGFADVSTERLAVRLGEQARRRQQALSRSSTAAPTMGPGRAREEAWPRTHFMIDPLGACETISLEIDRKPFRDPARRGREGGAFYRVVTDAEGRIESFTTLWTDLPELDEELAEHVARVLTLPSPADEPLEVLLTVRVGSGGRLAFLAGGAQIVN